MNLRRIIFPITLAASIFCNTAFPLGAAASGNSNTQGMEVRYEGEAEKLVSTSENFFEGFSTMLPGDKITETVLLNNTSSKTIDFYFRTDLEDELKEAMIALGDEKPTKDTLSRSAALLRETILTIEIQDQNAKPVLIYKGNLAATSLEDFRKIGHYQADEGGTFTFSLELPADLTNVYSNSNTNVIWIFGVQEESIPTQPTNPSESTDPTQPVTPNPDDSSQPSSNSPSNHSPSNPSDPVTDNPTDPTSPSRESGDRDSSPSQILGIENYKFYLGIALVVISVAGNGFIILTVRRKR